MRRGCVALSPKLTLNSHPKNAVRWKPGTPGFWKPKYGASKMKWNFTVPYKREAESLLHYPEVSRITGKPIDWYQGEPDDGYEGVRIFGENTLELRGMPFGKTPEYMQERLRRFFSKFGPVKYCRAEPHPLDPYQCEGKAFVTFRDRDAAQKALRAPLKFPASLHDKVVSMRHLDTDKRNDPDYYEKSKFWNGELISVARQLHAQLSADPKLRAGGKLLAEAGHGLTERELVAATAITPGPEPRGRAGVPVSKGLANAPTRRVAAGAAVLRRFGSWEAFLTHVPLDELFRLERPSSPQAEGVEDVAEVETQATQEAIVVRPRLVSSTQRARILTRMRLALGRHLHDEFSVWWREGKVPLPDYTQRRVDWWDHKPTLPFDVQIQSRHKDITRIFDERFLYKRQIVKARNEKRRERRGEWKEERSKLLADKQQALNERRERARAAVEGARCGGLLGGLSPLVPQSGDPRRTSRGP